MCFRSSALPGGDHRRGNASAGVRSGRSCAVPARSTCWARRVTSWRSRASSCASRRGCCFPAHGRMRGRPWRSRSRQRTEGCAERPGVDGGRLPRGEAGEENGDVGMALFSWSAAWRGGLGADRDGAWSRWATSMGIDRRGRIRQAAWAGHRQRG
jgi:hypothetical protein